MQNLILVRIPKTASQSLAKTMIENDLVDRFLLRGHLKYHEHKDYDNKISLVRDPVERTISHYYHMKQSKLFTAGSQD
jgi:hypothetical protein